MGGISYADNSGEEARTPPQLKKRCGVEAFRILFEFFTEKSELTMLKGVNELKYKLPKYIGHKDITNLVRDLIPGVVADYRYFSPKRYRNLPFTKYHNGVVALKFKESNDTHWLPIIKGKIIDGEEPVGRVELSAKYSNFDGFGHTVLYVLKEESRVLESLRSSVCKGDNCKACYRGCKIKRYLTKKRRIRI